MDNPLSKADLATVQRALFKCNEQEQYIERAERCGLDCSEDKVRCQNAKEFLARVNQELGKPTTRS